MQSIKLQKVPGERYDARSFKRYDAYRDGRQVGYIAQDLYNKWEVVDDNFNRVSQHTTIKAAARVAGKVL